MKTFEYNTKEQNTKLNIFEELCKLYNVEFSNENLDLFDNLCKLKKNQNINDIFEGVYWIS